MVDSPLLHALIDLYADCCENVDVCLTVSLVVYYSLHLNIKTLSLIIRVSLVLWLFLSFISP